MIYVFCVCGLCVVFVGLCVSMFAVCICDLCYGLCVWFVYIVYVCGLYVLCV